MLKRYSFWLWFAVIVQLLTAGLHSVSLFVSAPPLNDTERQLYELMLTYRKDFGAGFVRSTAELVTALSSCFSLLCLLGGLTTGYLLLKKASPQILKGIVAINAIIFGICFGIMAVFTILPPIILTGLVFLALVVSYVLLRNEPSKGM
jgi:hypothetical protein